MKTYLFDFDGTLVDSMPTFVSSMLRILDEHHIPYEEDLIKVITPLGVLGTAEHFIKMGLDLPLEDVVSVMKQYLKDAYFYHIPAKKNVISTLQELKKQGASLNILTASPHLTLDACLNRLGIYDCFDNVWSCDDFETTKANPEIYKMAAQKLGTAVEDVLFLDDNLNACQTAKIAGMTVCGVYDDSSRDYTEAIKSATDYYVDDFTQLLELKMGK